MYLFILRDFYSFNMQKHILRHKEMQIHNILNYNNSLLSIT